jgi:hypothetical protein
MDTMYKLANLTQVLLIGRSEPFKTKIPKKIKSGEQER